MKHLTYRIALIFAIMALSCASAFAQQVKGTVKDSAGEPVIGAAVVVEGTTIGTTVDLDGNFVFDKAVPADAVLVVTSIGYKTAKVPVGGGFVEVILEEDTEMLDEVVMIGYGVQKKAVVSAAISTVGTEMLDKVAAVRVDDALKGLTPGVNVTSNDGQPGSGSSIRIRGIGTINDSNPLYVVDGMPVDNGIDYLSPGDIERIDILKDAASCAVYGTRGANGVILVTTKKGSKDRVSVNYDFSYGLSSPWRKSEVLNATEYAVMMNEAEINDGRTPIYADPYSFGEGTDWQNELFNWNAPQQSHQLSISGTSGKNQYFVSAGYYSQDGIIGGNFDRSNYERFTARVNDQYTVFDATADRSWLNKLNVNVNVSYSRTITKGISTNSEFGSPLGSAIALSPLLSVYVDPADEQAVIDYYKHNPDTEQVDDTGAPMYPYYSDFNLVRSKDGRLYTVPGADFSEMVNPLADLSLPGQVNNYDRFIAGGELAFQLYDGLTLRSSINADLQFGGWDGWTPNHYLGGTRKQGYSSVYGGMSRGVTLQVENTLTYQKTFAEKHNLTVMLGQTALSNTGRQVGASRKYLIEEDPSKANLNFALSQLPENDGSGRLYEDYRLSSFFARASYDFDNRYMIQATIRRDGSSRFGPDNRFATFPSVSAGWNIRNESWMKDEAPWLSTLKLRASWGMNGNDRIGNFRYAALTSTGNNYVFGSGNLDNEDIINGVKTQTTPNSLLGWEKSTQTDVGADFGFFGNSLLFTADYFYKYTSGMLMEMPVPSYLGESKPIGNVGTMSNSGVELDLSYRYSIGDFNMTVGVNASHIKTTLIDAGNEAGERFEGSMHMMGSVSRGANGLVYPHFYGYETAGIFQNWDEVNSYVGPEGKLIQPDAKPGDLRFVDQNGDGLIDTDNDRTIIGKCAPDWTYGLHASAEWKGIDFSMVWQGVAGNSIFDATMRTDIPKMNRPAWILGRWTGEGTSNEIPRFSIDDTNKNWSTISDFFIKDASYFRLKNVTLGYTLPAKWTNVIFVKKMRVYASCENAFTFTRYNGFDPEISSYVDKGIYPQARTYLFGLNLTF